MERVEGERVNWCYSTFHHHHQQKQQQQQSHRIARILHSVTFRLQSRYGGHYVCAVVCLSVCFFVCFVSFSRKFCERTLWTRFF